MVDILLFALNLAWKIVALAAGWLLFKYVLKNGTGVFHDLLETLTMALSAGCKIIRKKLVQRLRKENQTEEANNQPETVKVEGTVV